MTKDKTCFFSGHRQIFSEKPGKIFIEDSELHSSFLCSALVSTVARAYFMGYRQFVCGGALGFDTMAARVVIALRDTNLFPGIFLHLELPCRDQEKKWTEAQKAEYYSILDQADEINYVRETYSPGCMFERNRTMADMSSLGIFYYDKRPGGGTAYTYDYFSSRGGDCKNLYSQKEAIERLRRR